MRPIMIDFPLPIISPRLLLRQPIMGYVDVYEYIKSITESMDELRPWIARARSYPTISQTEEYIRECSANWILKNNNNVGLVLFITEKTTSALIGHIVMWNIDWDIAKFEIGFWLRTQYTHKGYMIEATNALTRYCFLQQSAKCIEICSESKNIRSCLVAERLGFKLRETIHNGAIAVSNSELTDKLVFCRTDLKDLPELEVSWGA